MKSNHMAIHDMTRNRFLVLDLETCTVTEIQEMEGVEAPDLKWVKVTNDTIPIAILTEGDGPNEIDMWDTRIVSYNECAGLG